MSHRLFFGIRPPRAIREALLDIMQDVDNARWQDDAQLHLTLRYIGEVDTPMAEDIANAASTLPFEPFELAVAGVGYFEKKHRPTLLYARVNPTEPLMRFQRKLERVLHQCGLEPQTRKFTPHITLARLNTASGPLAPFLARHEGLALGPWQVDDYILYESFLREQGSLYQPVVTYPATPT
ncbi:RNA 2',3'-cyclic phosphodiesterase [Qipengyuania sp. 1NDH17]|uniref:RNA 2',3'-cyclic phosphodiesterase n=1 Tax=Qipengyuania polymorpha TaxID=2867234 RepID=A0ABS7IZF4_9SPHN|nr:RNA 2',3'-cyclic phosphodiesterase [Qipengyuania polymorpha]MBX7457179.1 RNA 2',3'-cyclic phosphodiesterase [Qipengyuania polymorpha]